MLLMEGSRYPSGMAEYIDHYGLHFSKKMFEWAVSMMTDKDDKPIKPITREAFDTLLKRYDHKLDNAYGYDALYLANTCKADYYEKSVPDENHLVKYVDNTINDPDGVDGRVFAHFYTDCRLKKIPIPWEDMI